MKDSVAILTRHKIRPSVQRVSVLHYLRGVKTHPTVDTIYQALLQENPGMSRTTVYNTLELLRDNGIVTALDFGEGYLRYDAQRIPHSHFLCDRCGKVYDIMTPPPNCLGLLPTGFALKRTQLSMGGICAECMQAPATTESEQKELDEAAASKRLSEVMY
ncbi:MULTISPECIES: Fur family transcriptional regulator [unclassified Fibrobacter]|uniref:Fur family transcriptional regulator n=1 Tax=unclassified Fibrobacter TaxID=2634177 RepID=UPI000D6A8CBB|nr:MULTISPECIES: transcriptional repressor [unclassified Fibrobacter]PWJ70069.1 Fur family peroxide stress response transcriptional regulator [Fibrobacter sp. UWR4]PZW73417.1 Fur family peroxide stress response transcriptional regulator [Fibrobacter sp. UWR1]